MSSTQDSGPLDPAAAGRLFRALTDSPTDQESRFGRYTVASILGRGASGTVYLAYHEGSDQPVALKVLTGALSKEARARAARELDVLKSLRLDVVPRLLDYGTAEGRLYFVTEYIEGQHLDDYIRSPSPPGGGPGRGGNAQPSAEHQAPHSDDSGPRTPDPGPCSALNLRARVTLLAKVADAVQTLHEHGVIHRDLKPSNILIDQQGRPVLVDLGLARTDNDLSVTLTGEGPLGTIAFMSPEQARGEHDRISTRSDVFSLGATAYLILTGHTPHDVDGYLHEGIQRVSSQIARDPRQLAPHLPKGLGAILQRACAPSPQQRYTSSASVAADFRRWLQGEPLEANPLSLWVQATRFAARRPLLVTAAACSLIAISVIGLSLVGSWFFIREPVTMKVAKELGEVQVFNRAGGLVHTWRTEQTLNGGFTLQVAVQVQIPKQAGGGEGILLSAFQAPQFHAAERGLALFRLDDVALDHPLWETGCTPPWVQAPAPLGDPNDVFHTKCVEVVDIFRDAAHPGPEVLAVHQHHHEGRSAIRIYDLSTGHVLYEAWHSGAIAAATFVSTDDGGAIIAAAMSNPHETLLQSPDDSGRTGEYPFVVFALNPHPNEQCGWINFRPTAAERQAPAVRWYRFLVGAHQVKLTGGATLEVGPQRLARLPHAVTPVVELFCRASLIGPPVPEGRRQIGEFILPITADGSLGTARPNDELSDSLIPMSELTLDWKFQDQPPFPLKRQQRENGSPWP